MQARASSLMPDSTYDRPTSNKPRLYFMYINRQRPYEYIILTLIRSDFNPYGLSIFDNFKGFRAWWTSLLNF